MRSLLSILFLTLSLNVVAQQKVTLLIKDRTSVNALPGVSIHAGGTNGFTDSTGGFTFTDTTNRPVNISLSHVGYHNKKFTVSLPLPDTVVIHLEAIHEELEEVKVISTRSSRSIQIIPTRVEVITGEELDEKSNMSPSNITMLLRESTGIQVQQTSAVSGNASFRLQGLPGRYTQLLKDGFPLYSGYSGGLSLLQVPPLDLRQVEVIKGSASTLYGGGAIAGLVNLITKQPGEERETQFFLNGTTAGGFDANAFYSQQIGKTGLLLYTTYNTQKAFDPANAGFSALPQQKKFNFNPKLFYNFSDNSKLMVAANYSSDDRLGGNMNYIENKANSSNAYYERNRSKRFSTQVSWENRINENDLLVVKNSINTFNNNLTLPNYFFGGKQTGSYTEITYNINREKNDWVLGTNIWTDQFKEDQQSSTSKRDYALFTAGGFIQNLFKVHENISIETGLRADYNHLKNPSHSQKHLFVLPRVSTLFVMDEHFSSRISGGLGYKMPTIFTEEAEAVLYKNVNTIDLSRVKPERSTGVSADFYYKGRISDLSINFNQLFFYTRVNKPLIFNPLQASQGIYSYVNAPLHIDTRGFESQLKLRYDDVIFFGGYTYLNTRRNYLNNTPLPFAAEHRLLMTLMYDKEENLKMGLESSYTGPQHLTDGRKVRGYWTAGFSTEKIWEHFSLYINFENFTDTRQTKWEPFYTGQITNPVFTEVYAPIDGFIFNGGVKIRL